MATAGVRPREVTPPPVIGKAGRYTVFITPPATPRDQASSPKPIPKISTPPPTSPPSPPPVKLTPVKAPPSPPPPVQVPPLQFDKPKGSGSGFGFFWDAVAKVQEAHSSLDEYLADWFGLNQSKYQWALNDYYVNSAPDKEGVKQKELASKGQAV